MLASICWDLQCLESYAFWLCGRSFRADGIYDVVCGTAASGNGLCRARNGGVSGGDLLGHDQLPR